MRVLGGRRDAYFRSCAHFRGRACFIGCGGPGVPLKGCAA